MCKEMKQNKKCSDLIKYPTIIILKMNSKTLLYLVVITSLVWFAMFWSFHQSPHLVDQHTDIKKITPTSPKKNVKNIDDDGDDHDHDLAETKIQNNNDDKGAQKQNSLPLSKVGQCMKNKIMESVEKKESAMIKAIGSYPIGTYVCSYLFAHDKTKQKSCTVQCPFKDPKTDFRKTKNNSSLFFSCQIREKAKSKQEALSATSWDLQFFHYGAPPSIPDPERQLVVFYSGESNITEAKRAKAEYQSKFSHVVSCHHTRRFYFTWTARHQQDFEKITLEARTRLKKIIGGGNEGQKLLAAAGDTSTFSTQMAESYRKEWHKKLNAAVIFISRCGKGGRDKIVEAMRLLAEKNGLGIEIHSFGKCQRTHVWSQLHPDCVKGGADNNNNGENGNKKTGIDRYAEKLCVFKKYRYVLALENTAEEDYVTEKLYHGLLVGAIPIYLGAPNVENFVPRPNSFISLSRRYYFNSPASQNENNEKDSKDEEKNSKFLEIDSAIRNDPKKVLNFAKMKNDFEKLDRAGAVEGNNEEGAEIYWLDALLEWRTIQKVEDYSPKFLENLYHDEPTCDLCNLALQRKCEPGA